MSRWIDADALIKENAYASDMWDGGTQSFNLPVVEVRDIEDAPSIDIVWCKECKHYEPYSASCNISNGLRNANADDYCSYGEREGE